MINSIFIAHFETILFILTFVELVFVGLFCLFVVIYTITVTIPLVTVYIYIQHYIFLLHCTLIYSFDCQHESPQQFKPSYCFMHLVYRNANARLIPKLKHVQKKRTPHRRG